MAVKKVTMSSISGTRPTAIDPKLTGATRRSVTLSGTFIQFGYKTGNQQSIEIGNPDFGIVPANGTIRVPTVRGPAPPPPPPPQNDPQFPLDLLTTINVPGTDVAVEVYLRFVPATEV